MEGKHYQVRSFDHLKGLNGITDEQVEVHLELYAGYVKAGNKLRDLIAGMVEKKETKSPTYSELVRRLGWETNGMRLHELYFDNLSPNGADIESVVKLQRKLEQDFQSVDAFKEEFTSVSETRGIGWTILFQDPVTSALSVHWVGDHHIGHPVGFTPILVMDLWEHAFSVYLKPTERAKYIEDFMSNIDWQRVGSRLLR